MIIDIPKLPPLSYGHGRDPIRERAKLLVRVSEQLRGVQKWLNKEIRYNQNSCLGHVFPADGHDPRDGDSFCKDCRMANPRS